MTNAMVSLKCVLCQEDGLNTSFDALDKVYCLPIFRLSEGVERFEGETIKIITACEKGETSLPQIKHQLVLLAANVYLYLTYH